MKALLENLEKLTDVRIALRMEFISMKAKQHKRHIPILTIRGESEFAAAFGIKAPRTQAELRSGGLLNTT